MTPTSKNNPSLSYKIKSSEMITATEKETVGLVTYQKIPAKCVAAVKKPQSDVADYW